MPKEKRCEDCRFFKLGISAAKTPNPDFNKCLVNPKSVEIGNRKIVCRFFQLLDRRES